MDQKHPIMTIDYRYALIEICNINYKMKEKKEKNNHYQKMEL